MSVKIIKKFFILVTLIIYVNIIYLYDVFNFVDSNSKNLVVLCTQYNDFRFYITVLSYRYDSCLIIFINLGASCPELKNDTFAHWHESYDGIVYASCFMGYVSQGPSGMSFRECKNDTWQPIVLPCEKYNKRAIDDSVRCIF